MNNKKSNLLLQPMTLIAATLFVGSAAFLSSAMALSGNAKLLPVAMLVAMMVLSVILLLSHIKKASVQTPTAAVKAPMRVIGALLAVVLFVVGVDLFGFYLAAALFVPVCAYLFGCHSIKALLISDVIVVAAIYLIFGVAMSKEFPVGWIW
ncbi:tripartite tricarboxylate transporter TctB family protein [Marinomonas ostreistagni]|uniref:tripartite tricarboxylate transporter TctB family protein n=1 Tax=Marinomonas ostreistagni TaxID=359209 RepID=UPI00194E8D52|nr:tripartite tricarboxylate transporter TctB family protein [Marinomonas ostreistagni]MBM6550082.1 tripartite tricarboxylate transporter TctB family protein [Marinomonas ostreistagni]